MARFNVHEWNHKRHLHEVEGSKAYIVMQGKDLREMGPVKVFRDKSSAEKHAASQAQEYKDRFGDTLATQVVEVPMG